MQLLNESYNRLSLTVVMLFFRSRIRWRKKEKREKGRMWKMRGGFPKVEAPRRGAI
uniref:Uncharacterized protein n=1 Tax=Candidatus Methanophagaceae archaeon ANME-1 ERB6 TaxID=2759912 RepID=A0A7G9YYI4_9EURY|nr:hypothetical protein GGECLBBC_00007 [Methanosarcinales archaeon ANME-1 ERB6]